MMRIVKFILKKIILNFYISDRNYEKLIKINFLKKIIKTALSIRITNDIEQDPDYKNYWSEKISIKWQIYNKYFFTDNRLKNLNKLEIFLKKIPFDLRYFEIGCGYPLYLKSEYLKIKIKNYFGYDINPHISNFFSAENIHPYIPFGEKFDIVLIIGGVLKYFNNNQLNEINNFIISTESKIIVVTHPDDLEILKKKIHDKKIFEGQSHSESFDKILKIKNKDINIFKI